MTNKKRVKIMKPVENNGTPEAPLQFQVKKDVEEDKKVKPKEVFDGYKQTAKKGSKVRGMKVK